MMSETKPTKLSNFHASHDSVITLHRPPQTCDTDEPICGGQVKRAFDFVVALIACILLAPLFLGLALAISLSDGGPVFFGHTRVGRSGKKFKCWKFRSMRPDSAAHLQKYLAENPKAATEWQQHRKLKDDPRVTALGQVLRKYSIDELPQLFNILLGDMSFVGPRPVEDAELEKFGPSLRHYLRARPGLTGLWQISGRSDTGYQRRVALDRYYVNNCSLAMDVSIILKTIPVAVFGRGAY